jgi:hypothetical protein
MTTEKMLQNLHAMALHTATTAPAAAKVVKKK